MANTTATRLISAFGRASRTQSACPLQPAPLSHDEATEMLRELQGYPLLSGFRGRPAADLSAAADVICRLSRLAVSLGDSLAEMEINPLGLGFTGAGAGALDAVVLSRQRETERKTTLRPLAEALQKR